MVDWEIEILNVLPCKIGIDFIEACKVAGIPEEMANQYLGILIEKGHVKLFNDTFIYTEAGKARLEEFKSKMKEHELEADAISKKTFKEILWEKTKTLIHPAQTFADSKTYITILFPFPSEKSMVEIPCIISSNREIFPIRSLPENLQLIVRPQPSSPSETWELPYIQLFLEGKNENVQIEDVFNLVRSKYKYYLDLVDERQYDFLALWVIGTYMHQMFNSYPYIFINGSRGCGKTKLLNLTYLMSFNAENFVAPSASSIFRVIQTTLCTLCIDEIEKISKKEITDIRAMLLSGYKKGLTVPRTEEKSWGQSKVRVVERYDVYSPKMMANITGMEDTLQDRCITIVLLKTDDWQIWSRDITPDRKLPEWQFVRNKLYLNMMLNWKRVYDCINKFEDIYNGKVVDENYSESFAKIRQLVGSRNLELWKPIYILAMSVSKQLFENMVDLSVDMTKEKEEVDTFENVDINIISALIPIVKSDGWYKVSELAEQIKDYELEWMTSGSLGKALSRLKIRSGLKKVRGRKHVLIKVENLKNLAKKFGLDYESLLEQEPEDIVSTQQDKLLTAVNELQKEFPDGFPVDKLMEKLSAMNIDDSKKHKLIEKALREGLIFSPKPNILKKVSSSRLDIFF